MTYKIVIAVFVLVLTLSPCYGQNREKDRNETVIKALERDLEAAMLNGDSVKLDRILADDYIEINARGDVSNKADVLALARARSSVPRSKSVGPEKTVDDFSIRLHGDTALVAGRKTTRYQFMEYQKTSPAATDLQNPASVDQERFIRTYSRTAGRWQLVGWQTTSIAKR